LSGITFKLIKEKKGDKLDFKVHSEACSVFLSCHGDRQRDGTNKRLEPILTQLFLFSIFGAFWWGGGL